MHEVPSLAVVFAAISSGFIFGITLTSKIEQNIRGIESSLLWLLAASIFMGVAAILIMRIGDAYPLQMIDRYAFVIVWAFTTACAKIIRYYYWKKKLPVNK